MSRQTPLAGNPVVIPCRLFIINSGTFKSGKRIATKAAAITVTQFSVAQITGYSAEKTIKLKHIEALFQKIAHYAMFTTFML